MLVPRKTHVRLPLAGLLLLGACVPARTVGAPARAPSRVAQIVDSLEAAPRGEQSAAAPRVSVFIPVNAASDRYIEPSVRLSTDGYAMVVAIDLDRRVRVLFPESPDESGFIAGGAAPRLGRFFVGFGQQLNGSASSFSLASLSGLNQRVSRDDGPGLLLAIASERPFQFDRLALDGEWDEQAIMELVFDGSVATAAQQLGHALSLTGQRFSADHGRFRRAGNTTIASFGAAGLGCLLDSPVNVGDPRASNYPRDRYFVINGVTYVSYVISGGCGAALRYSAPVPVGPFLTPVTPRDTTTHGSGLMERRRRAIPRPADRVGTDGSRADDVSDVPVLRFRRSDDAEGTPHRGTVPPADERAGERTRRAEPEHAPVIRPTRVPAERAPERDPVSPKPVAPAPVPAAPAPGTPPLR